MVLNQFFENIDMYGQPIQFTYKNKNTFSTICGGFISIIIISFLIIYFVMLVLDIINRKYPIVVNTITSYDFAPLINIDMNKNLQYNPSAPFIPDDSSNAFNSSSQISIGFYDLNNNNYINLDPSYFSLTINQIINSPINNISEINPVYFSRCSSFYSMKNIKNVGLNYTYCIYDYINLKGDMIDKEHSYVSITVNKCINKTKRYNLIPKNIEFSPNFSPSMFIDKYFYYPLHIVKVKKDIENFKKENPGEAYPYVSKIQKSEYESSLNVVCKPQNEVEKLISNLRFEIYFMQSSLNLTETNSVYSIFKDYREYYYVPNLINSVTYYFTKSSYTTFTSILPSFLYNSSNTSYSLTLNNEQNYFEDIDIIDSKMISIKLKSSQTRNNVSISFGNILDVFGLVGGISKILLILGGFIVIYIADIQFKESLINEFYSVIDPDNDIFISRGYSEFLEHKYDEYDIEASKNNLQGFSNDDKSNALNKYFDKEIVTKIYYYNKKIKEDGYSFSYEELDDKNTPQQISKDESVSFIDNLKYSIVYEVFKNETYSGMYFNLFEIIIFTFCSCLATQKLKKKYNIFKSACDRLAQDTDFLSIVRSVQQFESFKNIFFDVDQLNLFNSIVNPPVTIKEIKEIELKRSEIKSKIKEKKKELRDFMDKKRKKIKEEIEELKEKIHKLDNLNYDNEEEDEQDLKNKLKKLFEALTSVCKLEERSEYEIDRKLLKNLHVKKSLDGNEERTCLENFLFEHEKIQKRERKTKKEEKIADEKQNKLDKKIQINAQFFWDKFANTKKK
jgi:hypothetical protein